MQLLLPEPHAKEEAVPLIWTFVGIPGGRWGSRRAGQAGRGT